MATVSSALDSSSATTNNSPSLTTISDPELQNLFNQFDTNGDGKISSEELSKVLAAFGGTESRNSIDLRRAMEEVDTNHDGFISLAEFGVLCHGATTANTSDSELRDAFSLYDQDKNGVISVGELHLVMNRLNMKCSIKECEAMVKSVDADGDGNVNFEEFKKMMSGAHQNGQ